MYNTLTMIVLTDKEFLISLTLQPLIKRGMKNLFLRAWKEMD